MYIGTSGGAKTGKLPDHQPAVQVGDTLYCSESLISHGVQRFDPSFNRTAMILEANKSVIVVVCLVENLARHF
jgi:hypothetical protein